MAWYRKDRHMSKILSLRFKDTPEDQAWAKEITELLRSRGVATTTASSEDTDGDSRQDHDTMRRDWESIIFMKQDEEDRAEADGNNDKELCDLKNDAIARRSSRIRLG
jgi:hypothetical protein